MAAPTDTAAMAIAAGKQAGNINVGDSNNVEVLELSENSLEAQEKHAALLQRVETERRARQVKVPTLETAVKGKLRQLGHPVTLFAENPGDRRERLRELMAKMEVEGDEGKQLKALMDGDASAGDATAAGGNQVSDVGTVKGEVKELFYTPATEDLKRAREAIGHFSFGQSVERLAKCQRKKETLEDVDSDKEVTTTYGTMMKLGINMSQIGCERPLSCSKLSPESSMLVSGSWNSNLKVWDAQTFEVKQTLKGHKEKITGVGWHPNALTSQSKSAANIVSGSMDFSANIWSLESNSPIQKLTGHKHRLACVAFHPLGNHIGTASYDHSWRLWDVETGKELLLQDGHSKEVYGIAFQKDGALCATGDFAGIGRMWDLRSGKSIWTLEGHVKKVLSIDFSPNCYQIATGSDDNTVRIWDARQRRNIYVIPAHSNLISCVKFSPATGEMLATSSYDNTAKVWSTRDWSVLKTLSGHEGKVTSVDISSDERKVVTSSFDRTLKIWAHEDFF